MIISVGTFCVWPHYVVQAALLTLNLYRSNIEDWATPRPSLLPASSQSNDYYHWIRQNVYCE